MCPSIRFWYVSILENHESSTGKVNKCNNIGGFIEIYWDLCVGFFLNKNLVQTLKYIDLGHPKLELDMADLSAIPHVTVIWYMVLFVYFQLCFSLK